LLKIESISLLTPSFQKDESTEDTRNVTKSYSKKVDVLWHLLHLRISLLSTFSFCSFQGHLDLSLDYSSLLLQSTVLGPILILLGIGTWTLARHPHTLKYFKLDFLSFHFSYGIDCVLIRIVRPYKFYGKPELINNASIISFNVRFFIRLSWIG